MTLARASLGGLALLCLSACTTGLQPTSAPGACAPEGELEYLCGTLKPEDLASIPGTDWLIASGFAPGSGLKVVDTRRRRAVRWFTGAPDQVLGDRARYPDCATPPEPAAFNARGISYRATGRGRGDLHVINHGGRESVEVFTVDTRVAGEPPHLMWRGCLLLPEGDVGNSVATYGDGTVLVTVLTRPGTAIADFVLGRKTGYVLERPLGAARFQVIAGTELEGNNGLETSPDGDGFYVVSFGTRQIVRFDRGTAGPSWAVTAPEFMPDNIHWHGNRLLAAGMVSDEPACGGRRQVIDGVADPMTCPRGYIVALLDPRSREWSIVARGDRKPSFNGSSSARIVRDELWLGSYQADRLALRKLPDGTKTN
jgi:hypothetical protein